MNWDRIIYELKTCLYILTGHGGAESYVMWGTLALVVFGFFLFPLQNRDEA